ncbi:MAG: hypothetical protein DCC73_05195 [Proteobacteria bacterium]|jgi:hypothetical protein|nr:MAG: hypothetical protein DCC73_05195 [Pseudomonadota bacterium]
MDTLLHLLVLAFLPLMAIAIARGVGDIRRTLSSADVAPEPAATASPVLLTLSIGQPRSV